MLSIWICNIMYHPLWQHWNKCIYQPQSLQNPSPIFDPKSSKIFLLVLPDFDGFSTLCIAKPWMLCIYYCTKSIKLHRLLLLDSGLCIAKPWMLCICYCIKSIKLSSAAFVGFRTVYSQAMDALHLPLYQFHQSPTIWVSFYCMLMKFWQIWDGF